MIYAYDKTYLERARTILGRMLDFVVHDLNYNISEFFSLFIKSGLASLFENGDYSVIAGMSGVELAYKVLDTFGIKYERVKPQYTMNRSREYWTGWALAYYQWKTTMSFKEIISIVHIENILNLYNPYHEMDIKHFVDKMNELYNEAKPQTNLKLLRKKAGISQKELSDYSGIPLRTIQQYEQRQKNINNAQVNYLVALSKALYCNIEDLIEKN